MNWVVGSRRARSEWLRQVDCHIPGQQYRERDAVEQPRQSLATALLGSLLRLS
jgi:hypothetical protein